MAIHPTKSLDPVGLTQDHFDRIRAMQTKLVRSPITWTFKHVQAHQDDHYGPLDLWATWNVEMDLLAKAYWSEVAETPQVFQITIADEGDTIWSRSAKLCMEVQARLSEDLHLPLSKAYWTPKYIPADQFRYFDLAVCSTAMKRLGIQWHHCISKHVTGVCGVGKMNHIIKESETEICPCCPTVETATHVSTCPHPAAMLIWEESFARICAWALKHGGNPEVVRVFLLYLTAWRMHQPVHAFQSNFPGVTLACT